MPRVNVKHFLVFTSALVCAFAFSSAAQAQTASSLDPLLRQAVANVRGTSEEAQQYTYTQRNTDRTFDSNGKVKEQSSDTYEIIFLEGAPYRKRVAHDDKPLPEKQQKEEDKKLADVAEARRHAKSGDSALRGIFHLRLPVERLDEFNVIGVGSEEIDGRKNLVFTATPKDSPDALKQLAREDAAYEMKLWVDEQDKVFTKIEAKAIAQGMRFEKESLLGYTWTKINNEAWLPARFWFKGDVRYLMHNVPVAHEQTYSDYKKFRADSRILPDS